MSTPADAIPAASLILLRERPDGPEVLAIRRATTLRFAGDAWAFPGGRVDPADHAATADFPELDDAAHRLAAIRETWEETAIGEPPGSATTLHERLGALTPYARWQPPLGPGRRFDTRFFLAETTDTREPVADGGEAVAACWARPRALLDAAARGDGRLLFPTLCLLSRLATYRTLADARADAERFPARLIVTDREQRGDGSWLTIPDDLGYPIRELLAHEGVD